MDPDQAVKGLGARVKLAVTSGAILAILVAPGVCVQSATATGAQVSAAASKFGIATINDETVPLAYAYAVFEPERVDRKAQVRIILSDTALSIAELEDSPAIVERAREGKLHAVEVRLDREAKVTGASIYSSQFGGEWKDSAVMPSFEPTAFDDQRVAGKLSAESGDPSAIDTYQYSATFQATVHHVALPVPPKAGELAGSLGTVTVNGKTFPLRHAYAIRGPAFHDEKNEEVKIVLSDVPITAAELEDDFAILKKGHSGKLHAVVARLDLEGNAQTGELYHSLLGELTMALYGDHVFQAKVFDKQRVAGRLYMPEPRESSGATYTYDAKFDLGVQRHSSTLPPTAEGAAAAESGPGKVVLAFVKAASAKDYAVLKPLLSDELIKEFESREGALALQMVYALMPADVTITSVTEMGDAAVVKAVSPESKSPLTFRTVRVNGVWKMAKK
jgi:hypothetical protein